LSQIVIIGYGNPLRSDDAVGWHATMALKALIPDTAVSILTTQQLSPELAETVSQAKNVIFIDARADSTPGQIRITNLKNDSTHSKPFNHHLTPEALLSYSASVYGNNPKGMLISVTGSSFEFGETLSEPVQKALPIVLKQVTSFIHEIKRQELQSA
jgi:hydrogenase maturation protease